MLLQMVKEPRRRGFAIDVQLSGVTLARGVGDAHLTGIRARVLNHPAQKRIISGDERKNAKLQRRRADVENQDRPFASATHRAVGCVRSDR